MPGTNLEERVAALEKEVAHLKSDLTDRADGDSTPWWQKHLGAFKDDPYYEEAMRLGAKYRQSQRPRDADVST